MKLTGAEIETLIELAYFYKGRQIVVVESLCRHQQQTAHSCFSFQVENVAATVSGAKLMLWGKEGAYHAMLDNVTSFDFDEQERCLEIVELFDEYSERKTTIAPVKIGKIS